MDADQVAKLLCEVFEPKPIASPETLVIALDWESEEAIARLRASSGEVTDDIVRFVSNCLFLFNPAGLRALLPHVLCYMVRNPQSEVTESVVYRLYNLCDAEADDVLSVFSASETKAIAAFLAWLAGGS